MVSVRLPTTSFSLKRSRFFSYTVAKKAVRPSPSLTTVSSMVESNVWVLTNKKLHPKKCNSFSPLLSSSTGAYHLQKTRCGIPSRPRVYASPECEVQCLKKGQIAESHKGERNNPPLMVMFFALKLLSATPGETTKEANNIRTYLYPYFGWIVAYCDTTVSEKRWFVGW